MSKNEFICDCSVIHQEVVDNTTKNMLEENIFNKLAEFFKIIGDTTRVKILFALDQNEMCVCDIANVLGMSTQISKDYEGKDITFICIFIITKTKN